jgi:hypothetical protein
MLGQALPPANFEILLDKAGKGPAAKTAGVTNAAPVP